MFYWMSSCYFSVVSVPSLLCLTCKSAHATYHKCDSYENMLNTLQKQVVKVQAQMEGEKKTSY